MESKRTYRCLYPCIRFFDAEWKLAQHYRRVPGCRERWRLKEETTVRIAFEQASQRRRSQVRESLTSQALEEQDHDLELNYDTQGLGEGDDSRGPDEEQSEDLGVSLNSQTKQSTPDPEPTGSTLPAMQTPTPIPANATDQLIAANDTDNQAAINETLLLLRLLPFADILFEDDVDLDESEGAKEFEEALFESPPIIEGVVAHPLLEEENEEHATGDYQAPPLPPEPNDPIPSPEPIRPRSGDTSDKDRSEIELFPRAGEVKEKVEPRFLQIVEERCLRGDSGLFRPFKNAAEFALVKWLNLLPLARVDEFLQLEYITKRDNLSFGSGKTMREHLKQLIQPRMKWKSAEIVPKSGTTSSPVYLMYRDPVAAIRSLLDRPALAKHITYQPRRCWKDKQAGNRRYSEIFTADWAWETQSSLAPGSTLLPVLLGSDKAHLTDYSGNKSAWPVYLSLGNIDSSIRNKPSHGCWLLIAYIPIPIFTDPKPLHTALHHRLFHQCLTIILNSLVVTGEQGVDIVDSNGDVRHCFPRVAAYLADYPEQLLINAAAQWCSPVTIAGFANLGDSAPHPRRTKEWITSQIAQACQQVDPTDVAAYTAVAKGLGLNAVYEPFWLNLPGYEPDLVLAPDNLHGLFRFWRDHILHWAIGLIGAQELDNRLKVLQPITGLRHFPNGVKHLSQWTGREDRELQRVLLPVIAGSRDINSRAFCCFRAIHDFIYLAQYRSHSTSTLQYLQMALETFHSTKPVFISNGARRGKKDVIPHFCIPKLAALFQYLYHIIRMGSSSQFSTEVTENCHQTMAKAAYRATNRRDFFKQMCAYLNRRDTISLIEEVWHFHQTRQSTRSSQSLSPDFSAFIESMKKTAEKQEKLEIRRRQRESNGYLWLTIKPDRVNLFVNDISRLYHLNNFREILLQYLVQHPTPDGVSITAMKLDAWFRCRVQRPTIQDDDELADARTIQAKPPTGQRDQHGHYNCVLINPTGDPLPSTGIAGYHVAQLRTVFQLQVPPTHPLHDTPLAFVYWFTNPKARTEPDINMYQIKYQRDPNGHRIGGIIPLNHVHRLIQLIPVFGPRVNPQLSIHNSADTAKEYYINSFMDKEVYQAVW